MNHDDAALIGGKESVNSFHDVAHGKDRIAGLEASLCIQIPAAVVPVCAVVGMCGAIQVYAVEPEFLFGLLDSLDQEVRPMAAVAYDVGVLRRFATGCLTLIREGKGFPDALASMDRPLRGNVLNLKAEPRQARG